MVQIEAFHVLEYMHTGSDLYMHPNWVYARLENFNQSQYWLPSFTTVNM